MKRQIANAAWLLALALGADHVLAANPDTPGRAGGVAVTSGSVTICEGGTNPNTPCDQSDDCTGGGTCTGLTNVQVKARGELTIIADTKPPGIGWTDTTMPGCTNPDPTFGDPGSCETGENATFTLMLEFTLNAKKYTFASTFVRLPEGDVCDPYIVNCTGTIDNWQPPGESDFEAGWNQLAIESTVSERSLPSGQDVLIRWGGLPPAAELAVGAVVGRTATQRVVLSRTDSVPICTDTTPCNLSGTNPHFSDHSTGTDPLATVRRYKVDIAVAGP